MSTTSTWPGALVDCTVLIVAAWAAHVGILPPLAFLGLLFTVAGARGAMQGRGGAPPRGIGASSAVLLVLIGIGAAVWSPVTYALDSHA